MTRHLNPGTDYHVVDRDARVLAQQVLRVLSDLDVANHRPEHGLCGLVGLVPVEALEALLDVRRKQLQRPDVELSYNFV